MPKFSLTSAERLATCDERLQRLFAQVVLHTDCTVISGHRDQAEQEKAFHDGFSDKHWPNSNHNSIPSNAADVVPWPIDWHNEQRFKSFVSFVKTIALNMGIKIRCGADWKRKDYPHFEIIED